MLDQVEILGQPRGFGFVIYEEKESADKCLAHNNGRHIVNERKIDVRIFVKQTSNSTYWKRPQPPQQPALYEQLSQMQISRQNRPTNAGSPDSMPASSVRTAATTNSNARDSVKNFDEDSNYGGTTTEDDFNQYEHDEFSTSSVDSDSTHPAST
ncbi:unnamed protein product [Caenorhabditis auriculariae]|uniref:RRM domain-containing protein n=1 Tax=Caenorhabditis auriculariae TaxID=2777116 RepID=A0A8S1GW23_9PELO|nr:unnamed protein product [Caenorhabditis auriculariae]